MQFHKRILSILIIAFVLFTGMYPEIKGIDSSFVYAAEQESARITSQDNSFNRQEMCTEEILGISRLDRTEARLRFCEEKLPSQTRVRTYSLLSLLVVASVSSFLICQMTGIVQVGESCSCTAIISYIHHQDGSKG